MGEKKLQLVVVQVSAATTRAVRLGYMALVVSVTLLTVVYPNAALLVLWVGMAALFWYSCMSAFDWAVHRYVLHGDASLVPAWRVAHRMHHREYDGTWARTGASLTFPWLPTAYFVLGTLPVGLAAGSLAAIGISHGRLLPFPVVDVLGVAAATHVALSVVAVGIHNHAHSLFHDYTPPSWWSAPSVPVPTSMVSCLHTHHELHHMNALCNYCTVLLGFDWLAGTQCFAAADPFAHATYLDDAAIPVLAALAPAQTPAPLVGGSGGARIERVARSGRLCEAREAAEAELVPVAAAYAVADHGDDAIELAPSCRSAEQVATRSEAWLQQAMDGSVVREPHLQPARAQLTREHAV